MNIDSSNRYYSSRHKKLILIFIAVYLGQFLFCMFGRIESWPFSDYRIFQNHSHPQSVEVYSPYFELSDGSYFSPVKERFLSIDRNHFDKAFKRYSSLDHSRYIQKLLKSKEMQQALKRMRKRDLFSIKFVIMRVTFIEKQKHNWIPVYTPLKKYDIL